ncbi:MAG: HAD family hydrolase [Dermatophilaceae bacterium]
MSSAGIPSTTAGNAAYRRRLVALDVDGTILDHQGTLSPDVAAAVRAVADAGHEVVIATGRSIVATTPITTRLGLTRGYAVCSNGAVTLRLDPGRPGGYEVLDAVTFDPRPALTLLRAELPSALVAVEDLGVGFKVNAPFPDGELGGTQVVVPWEELVGTPVTRVTLRMPQAQPEDFMAQVERIGLHEVSYAVGWTAWLDINPEGVSKGSALEQLRRRLRIEPGDTVAVGDQRNDVEMLQWAARSVAMGNAPEQVQEIADEVTGGVDQDGLVPVLRSLVPPDRAPAMRAGGGTGDKPRDGDPAHDDGGDPGR